jgi:glycosyltransferase involved in cell wall biosynthesis
VNLRILFLTSRLPYPPHRGDKLKIWNLISQLSARHEITLLSFIQDRSEAQWLGALKEHCNEVHVVHHPTWKSVLSCVGALTTNTPFQVAYFSSARMRHLLAETIRRVQPDVIHTHLIRMAPYTSGIVSVPRVLDMTDAVSLYLTRFREAMHNPLMRTLVGWELGRIDRFEMILKKFDRGLVCSETDREFLAKRVPSARIDCLPNGVDLRTFSDDGSAVREPHRIILTGNMNYYPNADAAMFLVKDIFPIIKARIPDARLFLVGQNPPARVRALASADVIVTGYVEKIQLEYLKSSVAVSSVRFGAGTLNKVLEPLALGVPVVTSPIGAEGLQLRHG